MMSKTQIAINLLAALGSTSQEIAEKLTAAGAFGIRNHFCGCPLANYLRNILGTTVVFEVAICEDYFSISFAPTANQRRMFYDELGISAIEDFLYDFDHGKYPQLELPK